MAMRSVHPRATGGLADITNLPSKSQQKQKSSLPLHKETPRPQNTSLVRTGNIVFYRSSSNSWCEGQVVEISPERGITVQGISGGGVVTLPVDSIYTDYHALLAADRLKGVGVDGPSSNFSAQTMAPEVALATDNICDLPVVHEAPVLHTLRLRFERQRCYTRMGQIVLAINPYHDIPAAITMKDFIILGNADVSQKATSAVALSDLPPEPQCSVSPKLPPHVWAIAQEAYASLLRSRKNQSILITGESGAGKTESAKMVVQYLGALSSLRTANTTPSITDTGVPTKLCQQLIEINPLLEAFGNAKTVRNNNSSRFGKFLQLRFNSQRRQISGAIITNYLLEKSRVVSYGCGERNYHVFYQFLSGCPNLSRYGLTPEITSYKCLMQGQCYQVSGVDDKEQFQILQQAMVSIGFEPQEVEFIYRVLASILHLQNVEFTEVDEDKATVDLSGNHLHYAAELLGLPIPQLQSALTTQVNTVGKSEVIRKPLNKVKCGSVRDSLSKALYASLFTWIVTKLNTVLLQHSSEQDAFIGILDIFGFEKLETNSFEQLCINYANETLQQHYNCHMLMEDISEYKKEGIDVEHIHYTDNQPCLDLLESKSTGVFVVLDDQSTVPKATCQSFVERLHSLHAAATPEVNPPSSCYGKPRFGTPAFHVHHYAGTVEYDATEMLLRNTDVLRDSLIELVSRSTHPLIAHLAAYLHHPPPSSSTIMSKKLTTISSQFRTQLRALKEVIHQTEPHWIRCIKPNVLQQPLVFEGSYISHQLNSCGVLHTLQLIRNGYPYRIPHDKFMRTFDFLLSCEKSSKATPSIQGFVQKLQGLGYCGGNEANQSAGLQIIQIGQGKVFLKGSAYQALLLARCNLEARWSEVLQSFCRARLARLRRLALLHRRAVITSCQRRIRSRHARRRLCQQHLQQRHAEVAQAEQRAWTSLQAQFTAQQRELRQQWAERKAAQELGQQAKEKQVVPTPQVLPPSAMPQKQARGSPLPRECARVKIPTKKQLIPKSKPQASLNDSWELPSSGDEEEGRVLEFRRKAAALGGVDDSPTLSVLEEDSSSSEEEEHGDVEVDLCDQGDGDAPTPVAGTTAIAWATTCEELKKQLFC